MRAAGLYQFDLIIWYAVLDSSLGGLSRSNNKAIYPSSLVEKPNNTTIFFQIGMIHTPLLSCSFVAATEQLARNQSVFFALEESEYLFLEAVRVEAAEVEQLGAGSVGYYFVR